MGDLMLLKLITLGIERGSSKKRSKGSFALVPSCYSAEEEEEGKEEGRRVHQQQQQVNDVAEQAWVVVDEPEGQRREGCGGFQGQDAAQLHRVQCRRTPL